MVFITISCFNIFHTEAKMQNTVQCKVLYTRYFNIMAHWHYIKASSLLVYLPPQKHIAFRKYPSSPPSVKDETPQHIVKKS